MPPAIPLFLLLLCSMLVQTFRVIGTVRDITGRAIGGVRVSVIDENFQPIRTIVVDSSGQFNIRGLGGGRYRFRVETTGTPYEEQESDWIELHSVRLRAGGGEPYPLDFVLKFKNKKPAEMNPATVFGQEVPAPARTAYDDGRKHLENHSPSKGIQSLQRAIELFPDYFDALELLGSEYVKANQYDLAQLILLKALKVNPRATRSHYALGVAYLKLNRLPEAIGSLQQAIEFAPSNVNAQMMLGIAFGQSRRLDESAAAFKKALHLGGEAAAEAHFYLAGIYEKQGKYGAAARELELFLKESKEIGNRGRIQESIKNLKEKDKRKVAGSSVVQPG